MRTPGRIGGMRWESTVPYCRIISQRARETLGGLTMEQTFYRKHIEAAGLEAFRSMDGRS